MGDHLENPYDFYGEAEAIDSTTDLSAKAKIVCLLYFISESIFYLFTGQDRFRF
jgi:hypothetical protein